MDSKQVENDKKIAQVIYVVLAILTIWIWFPLGLIITVFRMSWGFSSKLWDSE